MPRIHLPRYPHLLVDPIHVLHGGRTALARALHGVAAAARRAEAWGRAYRWTRAGWRLQCYVSSFPDSFTRAGHVLFLTPRPRRHPPLVPPSPRSQDVHNALSFAPVSPQPTQLTQPHSCENVRQCLINRPRQSPILLPFPGTPTTPNPLPLYPTWPAWVAPVHAAARPAVGPRRGRAHCGCDAARRAVPVRAAVPHHAELVALPADQPRQVGAGATGDAAVGGAEAGAVNTLGGHTAAGEGRGRVAGGDGGLRVGALWRLGTPVPLRTAPHADRSRCVLQPATPLRLVLRSQSTLMCLPCADASSHQATVTRREVQRAPCMASLEPLHPFTRAPCPSPHTHRYSSTHWSPSTPSQHAVAHRYAPQGLGHLLGAASNRTCASGDSASPGPRTPAT